MIDYAKTALLTTAARENAGSPEKQFAAAQHLLEQNQPVEALPFLERASELAQTPELAALAGSVAVAVGDIERAATHFRLQLRRDPEGGEAYFNLGLIAASREDWQGACDHFAEAVARCPEDSGWHNDYGVALHKTGKLDEAERAFKSSIRLNPRNKDAASNLIDLLNGRERPEDAFRTAAEFLRYDPGDSEIGTRRTELWDRLPDDFRRTWRELPLHPSVYDEEYFASQLGTDETTRFWQQHRGKKLDPRFASILRMARVGDTDEVLDLGCGRGELAYHLASNTKHVVAIDYSEAAIKVAREVCAERGNVELLCADVKDIDYENRFALVTMTDVAEHLHLWELDETLAKCFRALVPGGQFLLHIPVYGEIRLGNDRKNHLHYVPKETFDFPVHVNLMTFAQLREVIVHAGFQIREVGFDGKVIMSALKPEQAMANSERERSIAGSRLKGMQIAIFASNDAFIRDIRNDLEQDNEVRVFTGGSRAQMERELNRADLAWFEWCDDFLVAATELPKTCPIVCRLHSYEAFTHQPEKVDWSKVDGLMFVNQSVRDLMAERIPASLRTAVIGNGLDFSKFSMNPQKRYGKKVAFAGYLNFKKNPGFLLACFEAIHKYDPEFTFHIAGQYQGGHIQVFLEHMMPRLPFKIEFDGWVDDMAAWLADKDYILSTSYFESFHYSIAEGIARGVLPLVYNWRGSENCYPASVRFNTLDECVQLIDRYRHDPDLHAKARQLRDGLLPKFNLVKQLEETQKFLADVLGATESAKARPARADSQFETKGYWETRLSQNYNLTGVGYLTLSEAYNRAMYRLRRWRLQSRLAELGIDPTQKRILDVGSGTGYFLDFWKGYNPGVLEGLDLTETAVARLRERYADLTIHRADISSREFQLGCTYDLISAFDVLFHIVDDHAFARSMKHLAEHLAPGGRLVMTVGYTATRTSQNTEHYRARTEAEYNQVFDTSGLQVVTAEPLFVTMNSPLDMARVRDPELKDIYAELWEATTTLFGAGGLTGREAELAARMALLHEQIHLKSNAASPSAKLVIVQKGS